MRFANSRRHQRIIPKLVQPNSNGRKPVGIDAINAACAGGSVRNQTGLLQDCQVLGNSGTADGHFRRNPADRFWPVTQLFEHLPAGRIR